MERSVHRHLPRELTVVQELASVPPPVQRRAVQRDLDPGASAAVTGVAGSARWFADAVNAGIHPPVQREADNAVGIAGDWQHDPESFCQIWQRLSELPGCAPEGDPPSPDGPISEAQRTSLSAAIAAFQSLHGEDIETARRDARWMRDDYDCVVEGRAVGTADGAAGDGAPGTFEANDATHQALANAWPRNFFGATLATPADGFDYLESQVLARSLPFDREKVNVVGIRGMQGGVAQDRRGAGLRTNPYDDTMFVVALDEHGREMVREFRGTCEPGGRTGFEHRPDPRTQAMVPDQQVPYRLNIDDTSKLGRPTITPRTTTEDGEGAVVAPHVSRRRGIYHEPGGRGAPADELADGADELEPGLRDRQRTVMTGGGELDRSHGIALHSGAGGDRVAGDSTGCQVVHGDWYGSFVMTVRRALDCRRVRDSGGTATRASDDAALPESGYLLYSLLDAADLAQGAAVRTAIAGRRAERAAPASRPAAPAPGPGAAAVQPDGGVSLGGDLHARASRGVAGATATLPHLDRVQAAFGRHDVRGIAAQVGGEAATAARSIGARAYAMGGAVAFAAPPDLRQAAHEAAHVVQQRGGVQLDGGVGQAGDRHERHADAVAEAVVRGASAEALLDEHAGAGARGGQAGAASQAGAVIQREAERIETLQAAIDAVATAAELDATERELDAIRYNRRRDSSREYELTIGGEAHRVRGRDLGAVRAALQLRRSTLGRPAAPTATDRPAGPAAGDPAATGDDDGGDGAAAPLDVDRLVRDVLRAIAQNECGGVPNAPESALRTSAGVSASYASATQATASHATFVMRGGSRRDAPPLSPEARAARRGAAAAHGISQDDLTRANAIEAASDRIWRAIVEDGQPVSAISAEDREATGFTDDELARMVQFRAFRQRLVGAEHETAATSAAVVSALEAEADRTEGWLEALRDDPAAPEPAAAETPPLARRALDATDDLSSVAAARSVALPGWWATTRDAARRARWLDGALRRLATARGHIAEAGRDAGHALLAATVAGEEAARTLGLRESDVIAYLHDGRLNRFREDCQAWERVALGHATETVPEGSTATPRTLDAAIEEAAEARGGWELSAAEYAGVVRGYLREHPRAAEEEVVRFAASQNGSSSDYPDRIWTHYQALRASDAPPAEEPAGTGP